MGVDLKKSYIIRIEVIAILIALFSNNANSNLFEHDTTSIKLRNFYVERDFENTEKDLGSWTQSIGLKYESGYTDTIVHLGLDLSANYALRLSDHNSERPDSVIPYDINKMEQVNQYSKFGGTVKVKYNKTELKIGELFPRTPVAYIDDSRQLVTTYAGVALETKDIDNLKFSLGRITHINARNDDDFEKLSLFVGNGPRYESDGLNYLGLDYNFKNNIYGSYWFGQLEDIYQQHYLNAGYSTELLDTKVKVDARYFNNKENGDAYYGVIDSQTFGIQTTFFKGPHTFNIGVQKNKGESIFPTFSGFAPQPYLHTWSTLGFIKPEELTYHALYSYAFDSMGISGLKATLRYFRGTGIEREGFSDNQETESNFILTYNVPAGSFKGLGFEWRYIDTKTKYSIGDNKGVDFVENRLSAFYQYKF